MYKTANVTRKELESISIKNQSEILRLMGSKLSLISAWEQIGRLSNNFKKKVAEALEADSLLYAIINPNKKGKSKKGTKVQIEYENYERERARKIKILALQLEMETAI